MTSKYEYWDIWLFGQNKANSKPIKAKTNPIQTQFVERAKLMQSVYLQRIIKKMRLWAMKKQTQTNPIFVPLAVLIVYNDRPPSCFLKKAGGRI